ncbi:hypothetical protein EXE10_04095 [Acinetobacter sp. WCHAc060033]|uniref:hypothetical protein n=1 Tax=Acinetobacter sp. WCHAc060033 TaxID=2518624 RepID=UPI001022D101|nr:hypothetical protein [Acinetobacter sp. WCHAc060033]RZG88049.1 hypothetical protein EXE10_04095 [Acinetobacter sp. WCHAc060033]
MKLKTFLIISTLSLAVAGCNSLTSKHVKCDDEKALGLVQTVLTDDLTKSLDKTLKELIHKGAIKDLDPAKLKLSAKNVQYSLVDSRTDNIDPDSTRTKCSIDLTVSIPADLVKKSDEARAKVDTNTTEYQASQLNLEYSNNKIKMPIVYVLQPTDKGDKVIATVLNTGNLNTLVSETLTYAFIKPQIEKNQISAINQNSSNSVAAEAINAVEEAAAVDADYYSDAEEAY